MLERIDLDLLGGAHTPLGLLAIALGAAVFPIHVGLLAATAAEIASRIPGWDFGPAGLGSSLVTIVIGGTFIHTQIGRVLSDYAARS